MNELEFVFKKMVEIDNKAIEVKTNTNQSIQDQEIALKQKLIDLEHQLMNQSDARLLKQREITMSECEQKANEIIEDADAYCESIRNQYLDVKDNLKKIIFNEIIESQ